MTAEELETPVTARDRCRKAGSQLYVRENALKAARDAEVDAEHEYLKAHRAAQLSPECPRPNRGADGITVAMRDAWVDERCDEPHFRWKVATANREAAKDAYRTAESQAMLAQSILRSIDSAFRTVGRDE